MALLSHYDPPGHLADFDAIEGQCENWNLLMQEQIERLQRNLRTTTSGARATPQLYDASLLDPGAVTPLGIVWNAFPGSLVRRFGREAALAIADEPWPMPAHLLDWRFDPAQALPGDADISSAVGDRAPRNMHFRPQDEYCEWLVERIDRERIRRVTFTTEPAEHWQALFGGNFRNSGITFKGHHPLLLDLYHRLTGFRPMLSDLLATENFMSSFGMLRAGESYDPYNPWNMKHGIVHLSHPSNSLLGELRLAADATRLFKNRYGEIVTRAEVMLAGVKDLGNPNRNSDVAIVGTINALARAGKRIAVANPVGVYIDHIDLAGWDAGNFMPQQCVHVVRGRGRSIQRLVVEMPSPDLDLSSIRIAGVPLTHGGQIAECISVRLDIVASLDGGTANPPGALNITSRKCAHGADEVFHRLDAGAPACSEPVYEDEIEPSTAAIAQTFGTMRQGCRQ